MFPLFCKEAFFLSFMFHCPLLFDRVLFYKKNSQHLSLLSLFVKKKVELNSSSLVMVSDSIWILFSWRSEVFG